MPGVSPKGTARPRTTDQIVIVPDTSVVVDGRITIRVERGDLSHARILVPAAVVAELEYQANQGHESGFNGLDELTKLQEMRTKGSVEVDVVGERPAPEDIENAKTGELDAQIRDLAREYEATLMTSDRVQAHVARAMGIQVDYVRPLSREDEPGTQAEGEDLRIYQFFDNQTMSVHLKQDVPPYAKKGRPGDLHLVKLAAEPLEQRELTRMSREIIEAARRSTDSFVEIERHGATVVQLGRMRIAIARPPFADGVEITAVRPVVRLSIDQYNLAPELRERLRSYQRGVFVSGPPGSGKSTFTTAVAEWLKDQDAVVKTMESPRDLQVSDIITQYAPLEQSMELTSDVLLLVRPDFVVYDEVRKTDDFKIFADMRLAGVGLIGVTHANRAIDAVQRLIGRVELGMIPQVVDTVIHIEAGKIQKVLEMSFTVKVPAGMQEADLARPVIEVRDFQTKRAEFEIYTYGEQVVVMPLSATGGGERSAKDRFAAKALRQELKHWVGGSFDIEFAGENSLTLFADERLIPQLIGRGGKAVQELEGAIGFKVDIRPLRERRTGGVGGRERGVDRGERGGGRPVHRGRDREGANGGADAGAEPEEAFMGEEEAASRAAERYAELTPELRKSKKNIVLMVDRGLAGQEVEVVVDDEPIFAATVGSKGDVRINRRSEWGRAIDDALVNGQLIRIRV